MYSPEPDILHELLGHAPMFANQELAAFSQAIGLASLGCSEKELMNLAALYWFTIEFGLCRQDGELKVYGAGILGGVHEMEYCMSEIPKYYPLDPDEIAKNHVNFVINSV